MLQLNDSKTEFFIAASSHAPSFIDKHIPPYWRCHLLTKIIMYLSYLQKGFVFLLKTGNVSRDERY